MFDKLKAMGAVAALLKDKDKIAQAFERVKTKAQAARLTADAASGAIRVVADGRMTILSVEIAPALASGIASSDESRRLAGDLITQAVNDALAKARGFLKSAVEAEAKSLGLPDLPGLEQLL
ncbi:MAG: YbaB/EbfC family nucleoid-associated protein [Phycisphaeraceae bacterium]|nr:MAG: YbaB/EbfC family nucleoid-associated protein [Phycisphaeraceae bacterium]